MVAFTSSWAEVIEPKSLTTLSIFFWYFGSSLNLSANLPTEMSNPYLLGSLWIQSDPSRYGFDISVGKFAERFKLEPKYQKKIDKVVSDFGSITSAQLEVKATIHFVFSVVKKKTSPSKTRPEVVQKVHALKPRFTQDFIRRCYTDL